MVRLLIMCLMSLLPLTVLAATEDTMLYIEYKLTGKQVAADSFDAQTKKVWRVGMNYLRFEDAPNPQTKVHGLIIVAEPDIWVVDLNTNQAQHTVDPGPHYSIHFPLLASEPSPKLKALEFGHGLEYFRQNGADTLPAEQIDGVKCKPLRLQIDGREVTLYLRTDDTPFQVSVKSAQYEYALRFLRYEFNRKIDKSLFQLPLGVQLQN
jgi:hypothetical protein